MKKFSVFIYINAVLALIFSFLTLSFNGDISLLAFPLSLIYTGVLVYFTVFDLIRRKSIKHIVACRELVQYEPFVLMGAFILQRSGNNGMPFAVDVISAILWVVILVFAIILKYGFLSEKKIVTVCEDFHKYRKENPVKKLHGGRRVVFEIVDTIDAIVWAVCVILLVNIFVVQLYAIPSESMVPTFLINDRAVTFKTTAGPKFPLSEAGLPEIENYSRGDVVVFRNPHYKNERKDEVKTIMSNFLYMVTFTLAKTNKDEHGELKADPLVKRVVGVPGEQLMLMDGVLYHRTKDSSEFVPVPEDSTWAAWNLNTLSNGVKAKVRWMPLTQSEYDSTLEIEQQRKDLDLVSAAYECRALADTFSRYAAGKKSGAFNGDVNQALGDRTLYGLFAGIEEKTDYLLTSEEGSLLFTHFMTDWIDTIPSLSSLNEDSASGAALVGGNLYEDSLFRYNVMTKLLFGRIAVRKAELFNSSGAYKGLSSDSIALQNMEKAQYLYNYLLRMDQRNMGPFPANDENGNAQYIPDNCYFMMGDNRYNSLDMRHSTTRKLVPLYESDPYSVTYYSNLDPQYVSNVKILGKANVRVWPVSRFGSVKGGVRNKR